MMPNSPHVAIYDFELLPYALGDVLTWNVQTAIRCETLGREQVDMYICMDPRHPASIYQRNLVVSENCALFLNELLGAFGTHPTLGNIHLYGSRDEMLAVLKQLATIDATVAQSVADYEKVLASRNDEFALNEYFIKYVYSHETINAFAEKHGHVPLLRASRGHEPDVSSLINQRFAGKHIVVIHPRLRRLDYGYGGEHTYQRDSDFVEWYEFIRKTGDKHPDVQFIVVGRLQEKPLELLRLPNVTSLRMLGMGLGHELTLMSEADLFLGTSSGFAAMANFTSVPYFITKMNRESCKAYQIEDGSDRLPFAQPDQLLIYESETSALLLRLLESRLHVPPRHGRLEATARNDSMHPDAFVKARLQGLHPNATTTRFYADDQAVDQETAFLIWPQIEAALESFRKGEPAAAAATAARLKATFPRVGERFLNLDTLVASDTRPSMIRRVGRAGKRLITRIDVGVLPPFLRGTLAHRAFRRIKHAILGYNAR
jgi:hypothetical protein